MSLLRGAVRAAAARQRGKQEQRALTGADSLGGILDHVKRRARSPLELEKLGVALGLEYSRWQDLGLVDPVVPLYRDGTGHDVESVLYGVVGGAPLALFDYDYDAGGGFEPHFTCAQVGLAGQAPPLRVRVVARGPGATAVEVETDDGAFGAQLVSKDVRLWMIDGGPGVEYHAGGGWALVASSPVVLPKWEGLARRGIQWAGQVAAVVSARARVV